MGRTLLADYAKAWTDGRADTIATFWAPDAFRFYKAEEVTEPMLTWEATTTYWRENERKHDRVALVFGDADTRPLDGDWSVLTSAMRWDIRFSATAPDHLAGTTMGGENRVFAFLNRDRLAGWCEAPDAPLHYMRRLYEATARF